MRHPELIALYASAPNHVFGQMLGLPGSCVLLPYVPLYWLWRHQENYYDCALVHPDEHLSRESRKLTVMMQRELVNQSMTYRNLSRFPPYYTKDLVLQVIYVTHHIGISRIHTRGYIVDPPSNSYG